MNNLNQSRSRQIRTSTARRRVALGAMLASLFLGLAACSSESGGSSDGASAETLSRTAASALTTDSTGVTEWIAHRDATTRGFVIEGRDAAGTTVTMIEFHGGPHAVSMSVDADILEMNDQVGVLTDTLSAHSQQIIARVKDDLEGTPAAEMIGAAPSATAEASGIGETTQAVTSKPTTTTANCVACWLVTLGTGAEFCYKFGHCDN